jgi:YD repeat-containing protein
MRLLIILIFVFTLVGCVEQLDKIEKFKFDASQIARKEVHSYEFFKDGRIKADNSIAYFYKEGIQIFILDSRLIYHYYDNPKVQIISDLNDSSKSIKVYNELDSLIANYNINSFGDTTFLEKINYENGKEKSRISRIISLRFTDDMDSQIKDKIRTYDTLNYYKTERLYYGEFLKKSFIMDKNNKVTEERHHFYKENEKIKEITYSFLGNARYVSETTYYTPNQTKEPDYLTIGTDGDTLAIQKTIFQSDMKILTHYLVKYNSQYFLYYNKKNQLIGSVDINWIDKTKRVYSYKYDEKGNLLEEADYTERINNEP